VRAASPSKGVRFLIVPAILVEKPSTQVADTKGERCLSPFLPFDPGGRYEGREGACDLFFTKEGPKRG
jgi:hypothetical protein